MSDALARSRLYVLLGRLLLDGFRDDALPLVRALPALSEALPDLDDDARAVRREQVWGRVASPYASAFLGVDGRLGGHPVAYRGIDLGRDDVEPDHVGVMALYLGFLCAAEADALRDGVDAGPLRRLQASFLDEHLRSWLPALVRSVRGGPSEWVAVVELLDELSASHRSALPGVPTVVALPRTPDLDDAGLGWRRLAGLWCVPAAVGGWLGHDDIDALADAVDVPRAFGSRRSRMEKVVLGAVDLERVPRLLSALETRLAGLADQAEPWGGRARHAAATVAHMRTRIAGC